MPKNSTLAWIGLFVLSTLILFGSVACQSSASSPPAYTLTVAKIGTGAGTVSSTPSGLDCGEVCTASFAEGTIVTLTATPNGHSSFETWSGDLTGTANPQSLTMDRDKTITVMFTRIAYIISGTVTADGAGLEGVAMTGLPGSPVTDASGAYSAAVNYGSNITVSPTHYAYTFDPASNTYTNVTADITAQNYAATLITTSQRQALIASTTRPTATAGRTTRLEDLPALSRRLRLARHRKRLARPDRRFRHPEGDGDRLHQQQPDRDSPAELGNLTSLTNLDLHGNRLTGSTLTGSIPAEIGKLTCASIDLDLDNSS